jgi:hypothetical protein
MTIIKNILAAADGCDVIAEVDGAQGTFHFSVRPANTEAAVQVVEAVMQAILDAAPADTEYEIEGE